MQDCLKKTESAGPPYALLAELTHRCPLRCVYCSNPLTLNAKEHELTTEDWLRVLGQAAELGVLQVHFSGGEPLVRPDLEELVERAGQCSLYSNLITSGVGLTRRRLLNLREAGLRSLQLSLQGTEDMSGLIAGRDVFQEKKAAAQLAHDCELPLTINVVISRLNIDHLEEIIELGIAYGAQRIELANCQYYGWALTNKSALLPTRSQLSVAEKTFNRHRKRLKGKPELIWVKSDYFEQYPKPCMGGWGRRQITIAPDGRALPCPAAQSITALSFSNVREHGLQWIWEESESFNAFRGVAWMKEPCRSCEFRFRDFGGCRCQAFLLTGDASVTDPVCHLSPDRNLIDALLMDLENNDHNENLVYRQQVPN